MATKPLSTNPVADLPENWVYGQTVAPNGEDVGLSEQHGYNYLMSKLNEALTDLGAVNDAFDALVALVGGKVPASQLPLTQLPIVTTAGTGAAYTATLDGVSSLYAGLSLIIVPHVVSSSAAPTLNLNGLGAKTIRRPTSGYSNPNATGYATNWLTASVPVMLTYSGTYWIAGALTKPTAADLDGTLAVGKGGTGKTSWTTNRLIYPSGATTLAQLAFPTVAGSVLRQGTSGAPYWTSLADLATSLGGVKIATGSYVGTGTYGSSNPCSLTFDFAPKVVFIGGNTEYAHDTFYVWGSGTFWTFNEVTGYAQPGVKCRVTLDGNTMTWYSTDGADYQLNSSYNDCIYYYVAIS